MKIGRITVSDCASAGTCADFKGPAIEAAVRKNFPGETMEFFVRVVPDERALIELALMELSDVIRCDLVLTAGGVGPALRDVTPEATRTVLRKEMPGFGEIMRQKAFEKDPTAILSRATAGVRSRAVIVNLPGSPEGIHEAIELLTPAIKEALRRLKV